MVGDGVIKNVGVGPDGGEPDQLIYSPQLRFTNDRWDITARYSKLTDDGTPRTSLIIGARDAEEEFQLDNFGFPLCEFDPETQATTRTCITDAAGNPIYLVNPFFGLGQNPAVVNCPGFNLDGTRDPGTPVICDGNDLLLAIEQNGGILQRNSQEATTLEAHYTLNDSHELIYKFGNRDTRQKNRSDIDLTNRQGGGVCSAIHPRVLSGELVEGQTHPRCALDGRGNGAYADRMNNYHFTSDQDSHELSLVSNNDGPSTTPLAIPLSTVKSPIYIRKISTAWKPATAITTSRRSIRIIPLYVKRHWRSAILVFCGRMPRTQARRPTAPPLINGAVTALLQQTSERRDQRRYPCCW